MNDGSAGTTDAGRFNVRVIQADRMEAEIIVGRVEPPQGWVAVKHGHMEPAPCISFKQTATGGVVYDTVILPLDVSDKSSIRLTRLPARNDAGKALTFHDLCALRIDTAHGTDYFMNDLRQEDIGPAIGRLKTAGPVQTDARTAVIRLDTNGKPQKVSAVGASFIKLNDQTIWRQSAAARQFK